MCTDTGRWKPQQREGNMCTDTDRWEGVVKEAFEIGTGTVIQMPNFIKIGSVSQNKKIRDYNLE
jgi:hypothetical protein